MKLFYLLFPTLSVGNHNNNIYNNPDYFKYKFPPLIYDRSILLINKPCTNLVMMNLGPSYFKPVSYQFKSLGLINDYTPWYSISNEIIKKNSDFDYVIQGNKSYLNAYNFSCKINKNINYPFYIGVNGWTNIYGIRLKDNNNFILSKQLSNIDSINDKLISDKKPIIKSQYENNMEGIIIIMVFFISLFYFFS